MKNQSQLCISIAGPTVEDALMQIKQAHTYAKIIELRLDLIHKLNLEQLKLLNDAIKPCASIFTLRSFTHGGKSTFNQFERQKKIQEFLNLKPDYIDLEFEIDRELFHYVRKNFQGIQIIWSGHFNHKIKNLESMFHQMMMPQKCLYKIATTAKSSLDALNMLLFIKKMTNENHQMIGICTGELGQPTRILGSIFGNHITFASLDSFTATAEGQVDAKTLIETYNLNQQNPSTAIYGLIGNPITYSKGHEFHNRLIQQHGLNAVYAKFALQEDELAPFLKLGREANIKGLSVTMPLKEKIAKHVQTSEYSDAINTLTFHDDGMSGINTDGLAVVELIKNKISVKGKSAFLLGSGGTALAVAKELHSAGANITFLNRTLEKAQAFADRFEAKAASLNEFSDIAKNDYDILINCTSVGMASEESPVAVEHLIHERLVVDLVSFPEETTLICSAKKRGCQVITGPEIFENQAHKQFKAWFLQETEK